MDSDEDDNPIAFNRIVPAYVRLNKQSGSMPFCVALSAYRSKQS